MEGGGVGDAVASSGPGRGEARGKRRVGWGQAGVGVVLLVVIAAAALRPLLERLLGNAAVAHWATIFVAIAMQAMPFLVLGVAVSAADRGARARGSAAAVAAAPARARGPRARQSPAPRCPVASAAPSRSRDASSTRACRRPQP